MVAEKTVEKNYLLWPLAITSGIAWAAWIYFLFIFDVGAFADPGHPWRIVYYVLLLLAPSLTFIPLAVRWGWPLFAPYAVLSWIALGYLLAFVDPPAYILDEIVAGPASPQTLLNVWYIFPLLFALLTTILAPLAYAAGLRLFTSRTHRRDLARAWREAGLLSLYLVGLAIGRSLGILTWPITLLGFLFLALVEALSLARR